MTSEWVLKAERLTLGYGRHALFRDLSFEVAQGEILGIVGPNGCGKTTLLRTMLGLLGPLAGHVERRRGLSISYVPQRERIDRIIPVTALEVVLMGLAAKAAAFQRIRSAPSVTQRFEHWRCLVLDPWPRGCFATCPQGNSSACSWPERWPPTPISLCLMNQPREWMSPARRRSSISSEI